MRSRWGVAALGRVAMSLCVREIRVGARRRRLVASFDYSGAGRAAGEAGAVGAALLLGAALWSLKRAALLTVVRMKTVVDRMSCRLIWVKLAAGTLSCAVAAVARGRRVGQSLWHQLLVVGWEARRGGAVVTCAWGRATLVHRSRRKQRQRGGSRRT